VALLISDWDASNRGAAVDHHRGIEVGARRCEGRLAGGVSEAGFVELDTVIAGLQT
jgi:hypothetical protein